jgi:hypothetical protein
MFPPALSAPLSPSHSEKLFLIISPMLLTPGGSPPVVFFHPGLCGADFPSTSPPGPAGVLPASARSTATHAWPPNPSPSCNGVFLTSVWIWWAHCIIVKIAATWSEELLFLLLGLCAQPKEDTGLSQLKQFLVLQLCCQMNFCKMNNFQLILLSNNFPKPCMFLLLLCLGTILAPSCPASCQPSCSPPPLSGFTGAASFHPFSRSTTAALRQQTPRPAACIPA